MNTNADLISDLELILTQIQSASLPIYETLKQSLGEYAQSTNATGDTQLEADIKADEILQNCFKDLQIIKQICSEEQENAIQLHEKGIYMIIYPFEFFIATKFCQPKFNNR